MFEEIFVQFQASEGSLLLNDAPLIICENELPGIKAAVANLAQDFSRVLDNEHPKPIITLDQGTEPPSTNAAIVIGSLESSRLIQGIVSKGKIDVQNLRGKWESFTTSVVNEPFEGIRQALVIAGSDKRGAIYGTYTLSEQIGVSPWYWWADVPPKQYTEIYATSKTTRHGEPSIRYRGIFLNDEAPALTGWVLEKFGKYNSEFYEKVFELLLRLKANFIWPAMWPGYPNPGASFFTDDPRNQRLADELGIVVSTSHHEPMQRLSNEWFAENPEGSWNWLTNKDRITDFFRKGVQRAAGCESYFTLGMRGEYDKKMAGDDPVSVVRDVIQTQRSLIREVHGAADAVPQVLACYKEVQSMYESGKLEVPEDVTLLFGDDNFGTIRRLPTEAEQKRPGGAGIYYHLEYVGSPRSYKWINSNSLGKMKHQLMQAYHRHARQVWVFNVGDLKPAECPLSFAMALAWHGEAVGKVSTKSFVSEWTSQNFSPELADSGANIVAGYDRIASIRKHELVEPTTLSILHYQEAELVLRRLDALLQKAVAIHKQTPEREKATFFQLILHPVKATYIYIKLQVMRSKNRLYARQRRNSANNLAQQVLELFGEDFDLSEEYHSLLNGKWNHMLRQPHYGYEETWHAPSRDMIDGLAYVQQRQHSNPIVGNMGVAVVGHKGVRPGRTNEESDRTHPSRRDLAPGVTFQALSRYSASTRWFEIFTRGPQTIHWYATSSVAWLDLATDEGILVPGEEDVRIEIGVYWSLVPESFSGEVLIDVRSKEGDFEQLHLLISGHELPEDSTSGYIEADGYISIPATGCEIDPAYQILPDTGRLETGSVALSFASGPRTDLVPFLRFPFHLLTERSSITLTIYLGMTLILSPDEMLQYDLQIDEGPITKHDQYSIGPDAIKNSADEGWPAADGWFDAVADNVWVKKHEISGEVLTPGPHEIRIRLRHSNMLLEKVVLDLGGVKESYLGPPPSLFYDGRKP